VRVAALDLGSNSFHLVVVEAHPDGTLETVMQEKESLRLGELVARTGLIDEDAAGRCVDSARRLRALAVAAGAEVIRVAATSALRDADNGSDVILAIRERTGLDVEVISGDEEARLVYEAIRASVLIDEGGTVGIDLGGGSLEIMVGDRDGMLWSATTPLGVGRLTAAHVRRDPPSTRELLRLQDDVEALLTPIAEEVDDFDVVRLVGTSGTLCAIGRMAAAERSGVVPSSVNQLTVSRKDLVSLFRRIVRLDVGERERVPGVDRRRADLLPAGFTVLLSAMDLFGFEEITLSEWALREGMVIDTVAEHHPSPDERDARSRRRSSVLALCGRCRWDEGHGTHVALLATQLFDDLATLHGLGAADRELLEFAGLLHDIGEHVATKGHDRHGAYLVQHGQLRGFSPDEVAILASMTRFHLRGTPKPFFEPFRLLDGEGRERAVRLTALLRLADGLDRRKAGVVRRVHAEATRKSVCLTLEAGDDAEVELHGLARKRELFERVFDREVDSRLNTAAVPRPRLVG
jgi:exopolyphosphatase/guanosine-5'-triphosphate,3'-diphosphate pyrophosphatase